MGGLEQEGFGIVFLEAAAAGIPQLAGKSGGAGEAVLEGMTGKSGIKPQRCRQRKEAICEILDDETRYQEMKKLSRQRAETKFSYDHLAAAFHDSLLKLNEIQKKLNNGSC